MTFEGITTNQRYAQEPGIVSINLLSLNVLSITVLSLNDCNKPKSALHFEHSTHHLYDCCLTTQKKKKK